MQTYYIFDEQTEEFVGEVLATSILDAELTAAELFESTSNQMYALSAASF